MTLSERILSVLIRSAVPVPTPDLIAAVATGARFPRTTAHKRLNNARLRLLVEWS